MQNLEMGAQAWFRRAAPYINLHKGKIFTLVLDAQILELDNIDNIFADIALLNTLDIKILILIDIEPKLKILLERENLLQIVGDKILLHDDKAIEIFLDLAQKIQMQVFAKFSLGMADTASYTPHLKLVSGNFVSAMPFGVQNGIDFSFLGKVRKLDAKNILQTLDLGFGVLLSPWGYSITGEIFGLELDDITQKIAEKLQPNKFIFLSRGLNLEQGELTTGLSLEQMQSYINAKGNFANKIFKKYLKNALGVCEAGVPRAHILDASVDGVLLKELFSAEGIGVMLTQEPYETLRTATLKDISSMLKLLKPLEENGVLIPRNRAWLESDIDKFSVLDLDSSIIGCVAMYPYMSENMAELACLAIDKNFRNQQKASLLLHRVEQECRALNIPRLFVLTTHTSHWFLAHGFKCGELADLPEDKRLKYDKNRASKIFIKDL